MDSLKYIIFCILALPALTGTALADIDNLSAETYLNRKLNIAVGYQSFSLNDNPNRAVEYRKFSSNPTLDLSYFGNYEKAHVDLSIDVRNEDDYETAFIYDRGSKLRFSLLSERFFHNLDHIPYDNGFEGDGDHRVESGTSVIGSRPDGDLNDNIRAYYTDHDPDDNYGVKVELNEVKLRIKLPTYPAHLNLSYWRLEKHGDRQLRFADENCTGCHVQSKTRNIDRVTNELKASIDGHFGYVDLEMVTLYREFNDNEPSPTDSFGEHLRGREAGEYLHTEDPDSTAKEITLRANTSPSGGLVGSASITLGKRENKSDIDTVNPIEAETDYLKTSADVTYTPSKNWTVNVRHRYLDVDNDNSHDLNNYGSLNPNNLAVRESIDFTRAWYEVIGNYRPNSNLTVKAELRREDIKRDQTGPPAENHSAEIMAPLEDTVAIEIDPYWELPKDESITKFKIGFHSRYLDKSALKISGWASIESNDDPSYGTSFSDSREIFLSTRYSTSPLWGVNASLDMLDEDNNDRIVRQFDAAVGNEFVTYDLGRDRQQQRISLGAWLIPTEGLSLDLSYGYLATDIRQDLLFGGESNSDVDLRNYTIEDDDVDYEQKVHTLTAGATWQVLDNLSCRTEAYLIRSEASYDPNFETNPLEFLDGLDVINGIASSDDLREISRIDIRQKGLKGRINWQIDESWSCAVEAVYDKYDDKNSNVYDGSVVSYMASVSRTW